MSTQVNYSMYENEIKFAEKYDEVACALDQLKKKKYLMVKELYKIVDNCLEEKITWNFKHYPDCIFWAS